MYVEADRYLRVFLKVLFYCDGASLIGAVVAGVVVQSAVVDDAYSVFREHGAKGVAHGYHIFRRIGAAPGALNVEIAPVRRLVALGGVGMIYKHLGRIAKVRAQRKPVLIFEHR